MAVLRVSAPRFRSSDIGISPGDGAAALACTTHAETAPLAVLRVSAVRSFPRSGIGTDPGDGEVTACRTLLVPHIAVSALAGVSNVVGGATFGTSSPYGTTLMSFDV